MFHCAKSSVSGHLVTMCCGAVLACTCFPAAAAPLPGEAVTLVQPDGRTFEAWASGDEWSTWVAHEGYLIIRDARGWWCYAEASNAVLLPGRARVGLDQPASQTATWADVPALATQIQRPLGLSSPELLAVSRAVDRPALVVLVAFQDQALTTTDAYWNNLFFGTSGKTARTYFDEVSGGSLHLVPATESSGTANDGVVRVQLSTSAHNSGNHPNPYGTIDNRNRWIVYDALSAADAFVNFSSFDVAAPSGAITPSELHLIIVVAGYEHGYWVSTAPPTPAIHSHRWALGFDYNSETVPAVSADGVALGDYQYGAGYVQVGELHTDHSATVGVPCHELGHDMGLIDLYDTTLASHGVGAHDLMGYGVWGTAATDTYLGETPVHPSAWSKIRLGVAVANVAWGNRDYTLYAAGSSSSSVVRVGTRDPNQYFLIENRQLQGFDAGLYRWFNVSSGGTGGGGLAIWHIDESIANNDTASRKRVDVEEANAGSVGYGELDYMTTGNPPPQQGNRQHYYYAGYRDYFASGGTPNTRLYDGRITYVNVVAISNSDNRMKCFIAAQPGEVRQVEWGTYLGGAQNDRGYGIALDGSDNVYVTGDTTSPAFPTNAGAYDQTLAGTNALFVTKLSQTGGLVWSTFFHDCSTTSLPHAGDVAVDPNGCAYLTGHTYGSLPTTAGAYDTTYGGGSYPDAFVTKFTAAGSALGYSTYIGSSQDDRGYRIALDSAGDAYVAAQASDANFPYTTRPTVYKLNPTGTALLYAQPLGTGQGGAYGIATDGYANAYVVGTSRIGLYTTTGAYDTTVTDSYDAFLARLDQAGSIDYATYLGGSNQDVAEGVAVDAAGYAYVTGYTLSNDFPTTAGAWDRTFAPNFNAFVTKILPAAYATPAYSSYLDYGEWTPDYDRGRAIALDSANDAYVGGLIYPDPNQGKGYVAQVDPNGSSCVTIALPQSLGYWVAAVQDIAVDDIGAAYAVGYTNAQLYVPWITGGYDSSFNGGYDTFVFKIGWNQMGDSIVIVTPDGGEVWRIGRTMPIRWTSSGLGDNPVNISLYRNGSLESLFYETPNDGSESWTVSGAAATDCLITLYGRSGELELGDVSNAAFRIAVAGDLDGGGTINTTDFDLFADCLTGPGQVPSTSPVDCVNADLDNDADVDLDDFAQFQTLFTGG